MRRKGSCLKTSTDAFRDTWKEAKRTANPKAGKSYVVRNCNLNIVRSKILSQKTKQIESTDE